MNKRGSFKSKFGLIAAVGGSVVGLGNIWRFPYLAGENGGAAFILVYISICFLISVPIMLSEFTIGRAARSNAMKSFNKLAPNRKWGLVGMLGIATAFVILSFYSVIAGWALEFIGKSVTNEFAGLDSVGIKNSLNAFINSGWQPVVWTLIFIAITAGVVFMGIEKGIERYNKIMMPLIVLILIGMFINSFTMSGFNEGVAFILKPDFSKITGSVVLQALGQSFFSLSLGMGAMITYSSYINKDINLVRLASTVSIADMLVAVLSGLAIFPAVFSFGISPTSGPDLVFITLPAVFQQMTGGYFISILFFFLLFIAAITSSVSMIEVVSAYLSEEFKIKRIWAVLTTVCVASITGSLAALSQRQDSAIMVGGETLFDFFNNITSTYMLPIGGFFTVIYVGWVLSPLIFKSQITNDGIANNRVYYVLRFLVKFIVPIFIAMLFLDLLGLL